MTILTPNDVHNIAFRKPPLGRRGYDEEEVDEFLDRVESSLIALYQEIARLRTELDAARSPAVPGQPAGWTRAVAALDTTPPVAAAYPPYGGLSDTTHSELELIKHRLARVEQMLGAVVGQNPSAVSPHAV